MNESQQNLLEKKKHLQYARNRLRQMSGIEVLSICEKGAGNLQPVERAFCRYFELWNQGKILSEKIGCQTDWETVLDWIPGHCGLRDGQEMLLLLDYGIWAKIRIVDTAYALQTIMDRSRCFTFVETETGRFIDFGSDSSDADNYQLYIWNPGREDYFGGDEDSWWGL